MALQIAPVHELLGVGLNLQDHPNAGVNYACDEPVSLKDALTEENLGLLAQGRGQWASTTYPSSTWSCVSAVWRGCASWTPR